MGTFHQPEVKALIESKFLVCKGNNQESFDRNHSKLNEEENILSQLQYGNISLENAEKLLLGTNIEKIQEKTIEKKMDRKYTSEELLSLVSAGEVSLEAAENLLLEVVATEKNTESI